MSPWLVCLLLAFVPAVVGSACYIRVLDKNWDGEARMASDILSTVLNVVQNNDVQVVAHGAKEPQREDSAVAVARMIWRCANPAGDNKVVVINFHSYESSVNWFYQRVLPKTFALSGGTAIAAGTNIHIHVLSCFGPDLTNALIVPQVVTHFAGIGVTYGANYETWLGNSVRYPVGGEGKVVNMLLRDNAGTLEPVVQCYDGFDDVIHVVQRTTVETAYVGYAGGYANTADALLISQTIWGTVGPLAALNPALVPLTTAFPWLAGHTAAIPANTIPLALGAHRTNLGIIKTRVANNLNLVTLETGTKVERMSETELAHPRSRLRMRARPTTPMAPPPATPSAPAPAPKDDDPAPVPCTKFSCYPHLCIDPKTKAVIKDAQGKIVKAASTGKCTAGVAK